jgi:hypothetical protein
MLDEALRSKLLDESCVSLIETYESIRQFALKLATFFTHTFPATSPAHQQALGEILDAATVGYLRVSSTRDQRDRVATFLANGVAGATSVLMCYRTSQLRNGEQLQWHPWEDGSLSTWAVWGGQLRFDHDFAPTPELRYATRAMLLQRLLRFKDMTSIARAGIDMQSMDMF